MPRRVIRTDLAVGVPGVSPTGTGCGTRSRRPPRAKSAGNSRPDGTVAKPWLSSRTSLIDARTATAAARAAEAGTWQANNPLMLDAHEFRAMWDLRPPHRWVIDLSGQHGDAILAPHRYLDIPHHEDRLYISPEFVSLWLERGWTQAI